MSQSRNRDNKPTASRSSLGAGLLAIDPRCYAHAFAEEKALELAEFLKGERVILPSRFAELNLIFSENSPAATAVGTSESGSPTHN